MKKVENGHFVSVHYTGTFDDGAVFDSSVPRGEPLEVEIGKGQLIKGFEAELMDMAVNEKKTFTLSPDQAYGERNKDLIIRIHKDKLPSEDCLVGSRYRRLNADGGSEIFTVMGLLGDWVFLDRNHPWAGKQLRYQVHIIRVLSHSYEACD